MKWIHWLTMFYILHEEKNKNKIENFEKVKTHWANKLYKNQDRLFPDEMNPLSSDL